MEQVARALIELQAVTTEEAMDLRSRMLELERRQRELERELTEVSEALKGVRRVQKDQLAHLETTKEIKAALSRDEIREIRERRNARRRRGSAEKASPKQKTGSQAPDTGPSDPEEAATE